MKAEEHTALIQEIAKNLSNQAVVTDLLSKLSTDYTEQLTTINQLNTDLPQLKTDNEALRSANMKLFLQVGSVPQTPPITPPTPPTPPTNELKYENLFNENGGLK